MEVTLVVTPHCFRFTIQCFDGCKMIASWLSITNYDHILYSSLINASTTFPMACIASRNHANHSYSSTQQITNLINYRVANGVTATYNTTNTPNKLLLINLYDMSQATKLLKLLCFSAVLFYTQLLVVLFTNNPDMNFIPITKLCPTHIPFKFHD